NGYYLFEEAQLSFLQQEVQKGAPVVLLLHTPLFEPTLYEKKMQSAPCAYLVDVPEHLMADYPPNRYEQQKADRITKQTVLYIKEEPQIKAIIAGHLHFNYEGVVGDRIPQIITSCTDARLIEIDLQ
ncbi:MAG: hypothetical protein IJF08_05275, partial [Clostridia bacterium]|nr:hypothetical protein [Clostridia bacterium]